MVLIQIAFYAISFLLVLVMVVTLAPSQQEAPFYEGLIGWGVLTLLYGLVLVKDGLAGHSPGKFLCGVQVVDNATLAPGTLLQSVQRNLPTLIPIVPLVIAVQLSKGKRLGDGWANTRVIWKAYRDHPVFTGAPLAVADQLGEDYLPSHALPPTDSSNPFAPPPR
jgi:uncharacterized RDD family membrane protein YckC